MHEHGSKPAAINTSSANDQFVRDSASQADSLRQASTNSVLTPPTSAALGTSVEQTAVIGVEGIPSPRLQELFADSAPRDGARHISQLGDRVVEESPVERERSPSAPVWSDHGAGNESDAVDAEDFDDFDPNYHFDSLYPPGNTDCTGPGSSNEPERALTNEIGTTVAPAHPATNVQAPSVNTHSCLTLDGFDQTLADQLSQYNRRKANFQRVQSFSDQVIAPNLSQATTTQDTSTPAASNVHGPIDISQTASSFLTDCDEHNGLDIGAPQHTQAPHSDSPQTQWSHQLDNMDPMSYQDMNLDMITTAWSPGNQNAHGHHGQRRRRRTDAQTDAWSLNSAIHQAASENDQPRLPVELQTPCPEMIHWQENSQHQVPLELQVPGLETRRLSWKSRKQANAARTSSFKKEGSVDPSVPRTEAEERTWVKVIMHYMLDSTKAEDNAKMKESWEKICDDDVEVVECAAWELLDKAVEYHKKVGLLRERASYSGKVAKRESFRETMELVLPAIAAQKTVCKRFTGDDYMSSFVDNIHGSIKRVVGNRDVNKKKKEHTDEGRKARQIVQALDKNGNLPAELQQAAPAPPKPARKRRAESNATHRPAQRPRTSRINTSVSGDDDLLLLQSPVLQSSIRSLGRSNTSSSRRRSNAQSASNLGMAQGKFIESGSMEDSTVLVNDQGIAISAPQTVSSNQVSTYHFQGSNIDPRLTHTPSRPTHDFFGQRRMAQRPHGESSHAYVPAVYAPTAGVAGSPFGSHHLQNQSSLDGDMDFELDF